MVNNTTLGITSFNIEELKRAISELCEAVEPSECSLKAVMQYAAAYETKEYKSCKMEFLNN